MPLSKGFRSRIIASALLGTAFLAGPAEAASVMIWPIDPAIAAGSNGTVLWLENRGHEDAVLQIRVNRWTQENGTDVQAEQADIQSSPPMVRIAPGVRQMIRLVDSTRAPREGEQAYRVIVDEVPAELGESEDAARGAIRFRMRYSVPLFVAGKGAPAKAQWTDPASVSLSCTLGADRKSVTLHNSGPVHARLNDVSFEHGGKTAKLAEGLLGYVLSGSSMTWPLPDRAGESGTLSASINGRGQVAIGTCGHS